MNSTSEFHHGGDQGPDEPEGSPQQETAGGFFHWLRSIGIQRDPSDRWFAGVASGIAQKAGIDPLIVRGVFVVLALLGGPGLLLYLLGWLLLPDSDGKIHTEELLGGKTTPGVAIAAVIIAITVVTGIFGGGRFGVVRWDFWNFLGVPHWMNVTFSWIFWIAVIGGAAYLVHLMFLQHGKTQRAKQTQRPGKEPGAGQASFTETATQWGKNVNDQAASWSIDYANRHEERSLGRAHLLITLALALISAGVSALWVRSAGFDASTTLPSSAAPAIVAALLAATVVIAISMIIAGLRGKMAGGVGFAGFLGVVALMITAVFPSGTNYYAFGDHTVTESAPASFALIGDMTVDLTVYDEDLGQDQVEVTQLAGDLTLHVPDARPTEITMDVAAGSIKAIDREWRQQSGVLNRRSISVNETAPGPTLQVHVRLLAGTITVR